MTPVRTLAAGPYLWGQTSVIDTRNNTVTYTWFTDSDSGYILDVYPNSVTFGPYQVLLYRETRTGSDISTAAIGGGTLRVTRQRLKSVLVKHQTLGNIRAYKLNYAASLVTARSLLVSVEQHGKDVAIDANGLITSPPVLPLPPLTFQYRTDANGRSFQVGQ